MKIKSLIIFLLFASFSFAISAKPKFAVTIHPLQAILSEIAGQYADIVQILPANASPHTFEPKPGDAKSANQSLALFYVSPLLDAWASKLPCRRKIAVYDLLPQDLACDFINERGAFIGHDPHFWLDPLAVKAIINKLADFLGKFDPANKKNYFQNANEFARKLDYLNSEIVNMTRDVREKEVFLHHPSFRYFLRRYALYYAGAVEALPGKEPTAKTIVELVAKVKRSHTKAIFSEPQLPKKNVELIARSANVKVFELDPNGGTPGKMTYFEIVRYNAFVLLNALK